MSDREREKTIVLARPVEYADETITEIRLRAPRVGERLRALKSTDPEERALNLVSLVSGLPRAALEQMDGDHVAEATEWVWDFFSPTRPTGES